jgi:hypothetical protein
MTGKTCLPCCCAWMPMRQPLTWRPGRWRARPARSAGWPVAAFAVRGGTLTELGTSPFSLPAGAKAAGIVVN